MIALTEGAKEITVTTPWVQTLDSPSMTGFFKDTTITADKWGNLPTGEIAVDLSRTVEVYSLRSSVGGIGQ